MMYFCVSDIHGFYEELLEALEQSGYDQDNENHHLMVVGDLVDRGPKNKEVLDFIYDLSLQDKATILLGNHDYFLLQFLEGDFSKTNFNFKHNGHLETIEQLLKRPLNIKDTYNQEMVELNEKYPHLKPFLQSMKWFVETKDYVFVHGGVNSELEDWRKDDLKTYIWTRQYDHLPLKDKTLIVGHTPAFYVRAIDQGLDIIDNRRLYKTNPEFFEPYEKDRVIHIDGGVMYSGRINVYKVEIDQ